MRSKLDFAQSGHSQFSSSVSKRRRLESEWGRKMRSKFALLTIAQDPTSGIHLTRGPLQSLGLEVG